MGKKLTRALGAFAAITAAVAVSAPVANATEPPWEALGFGQAFVLHSGDTYGICAGDAQARSGNSESPEDASFGTYPVGQAIPRNSETSFGNSDLQNVADADSTWIVAALYDQYAQTITESPLQAESFSWAVQNQLAAFGRFRMRDLPDGGKLAQEMLAGAQKVAGPYTLEPWVSYADGVVRMENIGVKGRAGWIPNLAVEVTFTHPVEGEITETLTTSTQPQSVEVPFNGPGEVQTHVHVSGLPASNIKVWEHPRRQDLVSVPKMKSELEASGKVTIPVSKLEVSIETKVREAVLQPGDTPIDQVTLSAPLWPTGTNGNPVSLTLRADLYGPLENKPEQGAVPDGLEPLASTSFTASHAGTFETPALDIPDLAPGYYTWVLSALAEDQHETEAGEAAELASNVITDFGIPAETFLVESLAEEPAPSTSHIEQPTAKPTAPTEAGPMLANTGATDLLIPAIALALLGGGALVYKSNWKA